jgi:hypothetical protein
MKMDENIRIYSHLITFFISAFQLIDMNILLKTKIDNYKDTIILR